MIKVHYALFHAVNEELFEKQTKLEIIWVLSFKYVKLIYLYYTFILYTDSLTQERVKVNNKIKFEANPLQISGK